MEANLKGPSNERFIMRLVLNLLMKVMDFLSLLLSIRAHFSNEMT